LLKSVKASDFSHSKQFFMLPGCIRDLETCNLKLVA